MKVAVVLNSPEKIKDVKEDYVVFADGGYKVNTPLNGKTILGIVGDFDSIEDFSKTEHAENVVKLNPEKNFTDGEYALRFSKSKGANEIVIYGANGGRLDHVLCNVALLKIAQREGLKAKIRGENFSLFLINRSSKFDVKKGSTVSILPYGEKVTIENVSGLNYPLNDLTLTNADTRGISNVATEGKISVNVKSGEALVFIYD